MHLRLDMAATLVPMEFAQMTQCFAPRATSMHLDRQTTPILPTGALGTSTFEEMQGDALADLGECKPGASALAVLP